MNLSQTEFGKKLGMTMRAVQLWEYGKVALRESSLMLIESTFNVSPVWLREGVGEMFAASGKEAGGNMNFDLLFDIIVAVDQTLEQKKLDVSTDKRARAVIEIYKYCILDEINSFESSKVEKLLKMA